MQILNDVAFRMSDVQKTLLDDKKLKKLENVIHNQNKKPPR